MIGQGLELAQIFQMMQEQGNPLFNEIGLDLSQSLQNGHEFSKVVQDYPFFRRELGLIINMERSNPSWEVNWKSMRKNVGIILYPS